MRLKPDVPRYPWFAGYAAMREGKFAEARGLLTRAAESRHPLYPVERLNARVMLTALSARQGQKQEAMAHYQLAKNHWSKVRHDFEVQVNWWLEPWFEKTAIMISSDKIEDITSPRFAC
jgi:tetratricopeptide (TPR) repeat protein